MYTYYDHTRNSSSHQYNYGLTSLSPTESRQVTQLDKEWDPSTNDDEFYPSNISTDREQQPGVFEVKVAFKTITFDIFTYFPLPSDHLLSLIRYNLYRAVAANSWCLGIDPQLMHSDIISSFTSKDLAISSFCLSLPPALRPTELQRSILHHPYIDLFPFPHLRDCLLEVGDTIDEDQLCKDFAGENFSLDSDSGEHCRLIVWGEPWDPNSWEIGEPLWKKWSWLFRGCPEALRSTNYWRNQRGEPRLVEIP